MLTDLLHRLRALVRRASMERELDEELRFHLLNQIERHRRTGMSHADATRLARLELGGVEQIKEACRDERGIAPIEQCLQDLHYASRAVRHQPAFALTVNKGAEGPAAWLRSGAGSPTSEAWPAAMHD